MWTLVPYKKIEIPFYIIYDGYNLEQTTIFNNELT